MKASVSLEAFESLILSGVLKLYEDSLYDQLNFADIKPLLQTILAVIRGVDTY